MYVHLYIQYSDGVTSLPITAIMRLLCSCIAHPHLMVWATSERFLPTLVGWAIFRVGLASESDWLQPVWYSPFIGDPHQKMWVGYSLSNGVL